MDETNNLNKQISRRSMIKAAGAVAAATVAAPYLTALSRGSSPVRAADASPAIVDSGQVRWYGDVVYKPTWDEVLKQLAQDNPDLQVDLTTVDPNVIGILWAKNVINSGSADLVTTKMPKFGYLDPMMNPYVLYPLDDWYDLYGWKDHVAPNTWKHAVRNGKIQQLTYYLELPGIAYRPSTLKDAGLTAPPATWDEFLTYLQAMKDKGVVPLTCAARGFSFLMLLHNQLWASIDGDVIEQVIFGDEKWTHPSCVAAAQAIVDLNSQGLLDPDIASIDVGASHSRFLEGKAASVVTGTWFFAQMQRELGGTDWDLFTAPGPNGGPRWSLGEDQAQSIAHNALDMNAAAAFMDYCIQGNGANVMTSLGNLVNTDVSSQYEIPQVTAIRKEFTEKNPALYLYGWPPAATSDVWQAQSVNLLTGAQTPEDWTASIQDAWETDISQGNVPANRSELLGV